MAANSLSTTHTKTFSVPSSGFFLDVRVDESRTASDQQYVEGTSHGGRTLVMISSRWHIVWPAQFAGSNLRVACKEETTTN
jgi:hypothetical protein